MPRPDGRVAILFVLFASLACNLLLGIAVRHHYIQGKLKAAEPTFADHYHRQNPAVRAAEGHRLIVLFGDSRIAAWNPPPQVAGYDVVNRGIGGETTAQMLYRFHSDVVALRPEFVIMQAGINDLVAAGLAPEAGSRIPGNTLTNLAGMVNQAKAAGTKVILLTIIPPAAPGLLRRFVWSDRIPRLVTEVNKKLELLDAPPSVRVVDAGQVLQNESGEWKTGVVLDTLHLTSTGYAELNIAVSHLLRNR